MHAENVEPSLTDEERRAARLAKYMELEAATHEVSVRTVASYIRLLRPYDRFLAHHGVDDTGDQLVIAAFALACSRLGYDPTSTASFLSAIRWRHREAGDVTYTARKVLAAIKNEGDGDIPCHQAVVLSQSALLGLSQEAATEKPDQWMGEFVAARDHALVNTATAGLLRPIEATFAHIEHFVRHPDAYYLELPLSKTNRTHSRHEGVWLPRRHDARDPVAALDRLIATLAGCGVDSGPLFRSRREIEGDCFTGLPPGVIRHRLTTLARSIGITTSISGYSLRRSAATLAYFAGVGIEDISVLLRHADISSTARYLADLPDVQREAFLDPNAPYAWAGGRTAVVRGEWSSAGTLETLLVEAQDIAIDAVLGLNPTTRYGYTRYVKRWEAFAATEGIDPLHPVAEGPAWFLYTEAERGQSPSSLKGMLTALEWWFTTTGSVPASTLAFARRVLSALERVPLRDPERREVEGVPLSTLLRLTEAPPGRGYWILAAVTLLRRLQLRRSDVREVLADAARFADDGAELEVGGITYVLPHEKPYLQCAACALQLLVERAGGGLLLSEADRYVVRDDMLRLVGRREPRDISADDLPSVVEDLAMRLRVYRRDRAAYAVSYGALLTRKELLGLGWEHLSEDGPDLIAHTHAGPRRLAQRDDGLDPLRCLRDLAAVWPWPGEGLWGCGGPIMAAQHPDFTSDSPESIRPQAWDQLVRIRCRKVGVSVSPSTFRVSGALHDWHQHHDIVRLSRRLGHTTVAKTEEFLRRRGVLHRSPTEERE